MMIAYTAAVSETAMVVSEDGILHTVLAKPKFVKINFDVNNNFIDSRMSFQKKTNRRWIKKIHH